MKNFLSRSEVSPFQEGGLAALRDLSSRRAVPLPPLVYRLQLAWRSERRST